MRRFNQDDEEWNENIFNDMDDDDDDDGDEYDEMVEELNARQLDLVQVDLNQRLLFKIMDTLEKSWLWKFKSKEKKVEAVVQTYNIMKELVNNLQKE